MTRAEYFPLEANNEEAAKLADDIVRLTTEQRRVEAELRMAREQLRALIVPQFFEVARGSSKPPQGVVVLGQGRADLHVCVPKHVCRVDGKAIPHYAAECFEGHQQLRAMIKAPENSNLDRLKANVGDALSGYGEPRWATKILAVDGFHKNRHQLFSPQQNIEIDAAAPLLLRVLPE
jgi:hypothetical protein